MMNLIKFWIGLLAEIDTHRISQVLKENWLGSNYSKRIWNNQQEIANQMQEKIMQRFMTGQPPKKIMQEMLRSGGLVETDIYKYNRLLRTETSYVVNRTDLEVSKKLGIDKRMFIATLDSRTSSKCREQHNKIVYIKDTVIGVNTPPLHPFCRSIMVDYIPGLSDDREWEEKEVENLEKDKEKVSNIIRDKKSINIEIDEYTPCLRRLKDDKIIDTTIEEIKISDKISNELNKKGWLFDWSNVHQEGYKVFALKIPNDSRIQGLVATKNDVFNKSIDIGLVESAPFNSAYNTFVEGKEYAGVGAHLFAEAVKQSYESGYDDFVKFRAKTRLISYYQEKLNAVLISRDGRMFIDEEGAKILYEKYYGRKK